MISVVYIRWNKLTDENSIFIQHYNKRQRQCIQNRLTNRSENLTAHTKQITYWKQLYWKVTGQFAELRFAECFFAECQFVECILPTCLFADASKSRSAKSRNAICRHAFSPTCKNSECQLVEMSIRRNANLPKCKFAEVN